MSNAAMKSDFNYKTLNLKDDYEGKVTATLIAAKANTGKRTAILYIHGFIDYFFHPHVAKRFDENGFDFFALDLRKYGHSLMNHQRACYCKTLDEYFEEIDMSIKDIIGTGSQSVILLGHSTGGLTSCLYANYGAEKKYVSAVLLNSPFFEMNLPKSKHNALKIATKIVPLFSPYAKVKDAVPEVYVKGLHKDLKGEWEFNLDWKPLKGFPAYFAWFKAVMSGHKKLQTNSNITAPVLVMHSDRSLPKKWEKKDFSTTDIVLNVEHIKDVGLKLGKKVSFLEVKEGIHDLFLSAEKTRNTAFEGMFKWLHANVK